MNIEHQKDTRPHKESRPFKSRLRTALLQAALLGALALAAALAVNHLRPGGISLTADWSPGARLSAEAGESMVIPLEQAIALQGSGRAIFVDARPRELYLEGHIRGALNVPWQQVNDYMSAFLEKTPDPEAPVITYCDGESCELSENLAMMLRDMGYTNVKVLVNGWTAWKDNGYPIEKGAGS